MGDEGPNRRREALAQRLQDAPNRGWLWSLWAHSSALRAVLFVLLMAGVVIALASCSKKKVDTAALGINIDSSYMMRTEGIDMLVSDSGVTKYRLLSPMWLVYDSKDRQEWLFPLGLKLEGYDTVRPSDVLILADTARYLPQLEQWELWGHVRIHGPRGERLYTPRLVWLKGQRRMYSDDTTYFRTEGRELHGERFDASDDLSTYTIYNNRGAVEYEEEG